MMVNLEINVKRRCQNNEYHGLYNKRTHTQRTSKISERPLRQVLAEVLLFLYYLQCYYYPNDMKTERFETSEKCLENIDH